MSVGAAPDWRGDVRRLLATPGARVHMLGAGGIGMAGLAHLLAGLGQRVDGCDRGVPRTVDWLKAGGIEVAAGHDPAHLEGADWAVFSPAVGPENPERMMAERMGLPLYRRGQVLAVLAERWRTLAVAGSHGKTTTAAMIAHIMRARGTGVSWCVGGELAPDNAPAGLGSGEWLVAEADESDGTLALYEPELAVITNIEFDHMEYFGEEAELVACFEEFARRAGGVVAGADDAEAARLGRAVGATLFGFGAGADVRAEELVAEANGTRFRLCWAGGGGGAWLPVTGRHNVLNALAAVAACRHMGVEPAAAVAALATFRLPRRRFELVAAAGGLRVVADYAHHPAEIRALIEATRQAGAERIWAVFQPHRYTRTQMLGAQFPAAFAGVAGVILLPVYAASEEPLPGGREQDLLAHFERQGGGAVELAADLEEAAERVAARWQDGDWVLVIGAGDVEALGPMLKERLSRAR